jgi:hypothetical protein
MQRTSQPNPWRMMILLAVTWAAGSLLFAAETPAPPSAKPDQPAEQTPKEPAEPGPSEPEGTPAGAQAGDTDDAIADDEGEQDPGAQAEAKPEEKKPEEEKPEEKKGSDAQRASAADKGSPQRFVPSEQVRADFDVSFPIDI